MAYVENGRNIHAVCRLDYLAGTLATAYKGGIGSLVAKDFCMSDNGTETTLQGTILAVPSGDYEASLIQNGTELARIRLEKNGAFIFSADSRQIAASRGLQIDLIQSGRHIGTFLLKKENAGGLYISATELSEELAGVDLTLLTVPLRDKAGLLRTAEDIISQAHSTKKDWAAFSEKTTGFARDYYWSDRGAFYRAFPVLARFLLTAAARAAADDRSRLVSNYFDLLDLLLAEENDPPLQRSLCNVWADGLTRSLIDLAPQAPRTARAFLQVHEAFPTIVMGGALKLLIASLEKALAAPSFPAEAVLAPLAALIPAEDAGSLKRFGAEGLKRMKQSLDEAGLRLAADDVRGALELITRLDFELLDERKAVELLFDIAERDLTAQSAGPVVEAVTAFLAASREPSGRALKASGMSIPRIMERLIALGRADACAGLLSNMSAINRELTERVLLDLRVARAVLGAGREPLMGLYVDGLKRTVIPAARVRGISPDTWAELVDPLHLERLGSFLELLATGDGRLEAVLVHVIANLAAGGVLIPDDRLFQRRVSAYLNSDAMTGNFLLNYLLLSRLPVYFNDVGAVSRIRDYSTELDAWGNDPVIYFLRKQVHVNASSNNVRLIEAVLRSWVRGAPSVLGNVVPPEIHRRIDRRLLDRYGAVLGRFFRDRGVVDDGGFHPDRILQINDEAIDEQLRDREGKDSEAAAKARLMCKLYKEVSRKYSLLSRDALPSDVHARLRDAAAQLAELKSVILSPERTTPQEALYFKRHIAFGIPSVLGTYHEPKFDALCELMRRGEELPVLLEELIAEIGRPGGTAADEAMRQWLASPGLAWQALRQFGMRNDRIDEFAAVLDRVRLHPAQVVDVLKMWQKELAWSVSSLTRTFHARLREVISAFPRDELPELLLGLDATAPDFIVRATDIVMRDLLSSVPGLVESDRLLDALTAFFRLHREIGLPDKPGARSLPGINGFIVLHDLTLPEALLLGPELGSKAKNLVIVKDKGLPVPPGVVLPARHDGGRGLDEDPGPFHSLVREAVRALEARTGKEFGGPGNPLFLSVRSGSYPSMPGILNSILYCGMNDDTVAAFIRTAGDPALAWDSRRRFIEHYGVAVLGLDIEFFERIAVAEAGEAPGAQRPRDAAFLKTLVSSYAAQLRVRGLEVPYDAQEQLRQCIRAIYASWDSVRARRFRSATGTSNQWGTSVTLMEMVPGNREGSGVSVFFTRDPATLEAVPFGETRENASGDELASGRIVGRPLSRRQDVAGPASLEETDPGLYGLHRDLARSIEDAFGGLPQEVEVTYTRVGSNVPRLFVLQVRRMAQEETSAGTFDEICRMESRVIGRGLGANGGTLSGAASFAETPEQIRGLAEKTGMPVILIRRTANTDDVSLMPAISGIVTAAGGVTSHAAVLAHTFGITAVVACVDLMFGTRGAGGAPATIGSVEVREGTPLSIDGSTGLVFSGACFPSRAPARTSVRTSP